MNNDEFKMLGAKLLDGTATPEEKQAFMQYYLLLQQRYPEWDASVMGDEEAFRKTLFLDVMDRIDHVERRRRSMRFMRIAASLLLLVSIGAWLYYAKGRREQPVKLLSVTTKGNIKKIVLPDSTRIWLNNASSLTFPEKFGSGERVVTLSGEAYFEVAGAAEQPFILRTGRITTQVLGTSFNVKAYGEDKTIAVTVLNGKVGVKTAQQLQLLLVTADQRAVYDKADNKLEHEDNIAAGDMAAWKEGKLLFRNAPLEEVVAALRRKYGVTIDYSSQMAACPVFADFNNEPLDKILQVLAISLRGKIISKDDGYYIKGKGCH